MKGVIFFLLGSALSVNALNLVRRDNPSVLGLPIERRSDVSFKTRRVAKRGTVNVELDQLKSVLYVATVDVGTPPQTVKLDLDTGSSDMWVFSPEASICANDGCAVNGLYDMSKSSSVKATNALFNTSYGDGTTADGPYVIDSIKIGGSTLKYQFGVATHYDSTVGDRNTTTGLLGVGYPNLEATGTGPSYSNLPQALAEAGLTNSAAFSLWLDDLASNKGQILFGGVNKAKYHGDLAILDLVVGTQGSNATEYYVAMSGLSVTNGGSKTKGPEITVPALLDSGTSISQLPAAYVEFIVNALNGSLDTTSADLVAPCSLKTSGITVDFEFGGAVINVPASELLVSEELDPASGKPLVDANKKALCSLGISPIDEGDPVILGDSFLRSAYIVYDQPNFQVAIANTNFNSTTDDIVEITSDATNTDNPDSIPGVTTLAAAPSATITATGAVGPGGGQTSKISSASGIPIITSHPQSTSGSTSKAASSVHASKFTVFVSMLGMLFGAAFVIYF